MIEVLVALSAAALAISTWQRERTETRRNKAAEFVGEHLRRERQKNDLTVLNTVLVMNGQQPVKTVEELYRHLSQYPEEAGELLLLQTNPMASRWWPTVVALNSHPRDKRQERQESQQRSQQESQQEADAATEEQSQCQV